jgi:hypothetical protein
MNVCKIAPGDFFLAQEVKRIDGGSKVPRHELREKAEKSQRKAHRAEIRDRASQDPDKEHICYVYKY